MYTGFLRWQQETKIILFAKEALSVNPTHLFNRLPQNDSHQNYPSVVIKISAPILSWIQSLKSK